MRSFGCEPPRPMGRTSSGRALVITNSSQGDAWSVGSPPLSLIKASWSVFGSPPRECNKAWSVIGSPPRESKDAWPVLGTPPFSTEKAWTVLGSPPTSVPHHSGARACSPCTYVDVDFLEEVASEDAGRAVPGVSRRTPSLPSSSSRVPRGYEASTTASSRR